MELDELKQENNTIYIYIKRRKAGGIMVQMVIFMDHGINMVHQGTSKNTTLVVS